MGVASFLGGSGRITVTLATLLLELTDDASMIAPVGIACLVAMLVGNQLGHGLYHGLIPVFDIPFLNSAPAPLMWLAKVREVMSRKLVVVPSVATLDELKALIARCDKEEGEEGRCTHHAFPVVREKGDYTLDGIITLEQVRDAVRLSEAAKVAKAGGDETVLNRTKSLAKVQNTHQAWAKIRKHLAKGRTGDGVHVLDVCDRSPLTVPAWGRIARAYTVFRKLGMRHLCVVDDRRRVVGILTRKDLMTFKIREGAAAAKIQSVARGVLARKGWVPSTEKDSKGRKRLNLDQALAKASTSFSEVDGEMITGVAGPKKGSHKVLPECETKEDPKSKNKDPRPLCPECEARRLKNGALATAEGPRDTGSWTTDAEGAQPGDPPAGYKPGGDG